MSVSGIHSGALPPSLLPLSLFFCFPSSLLGPSLLGWLFVIDHIYKCL